MILFHETWEAFCGRHKAWLARVPIAAPIYAMASAAITELEKPSLGRNRRPILDNEAARAERDLTAFCRQTKSVGVLNGQGILYPLLRLGDQTGPNQDWLECRDDMGWTAAQIAWTDHLQDAITTVTDRLKGVAGWLSLEPVFLSEIEALSRLWTALPEASRPSFPLHRPLRVLLPPSGSQPLSQERSRFSASLASFMDRWGLAELATWDLPVPLGPHLPEIGSSALVSSSTAVLRLTVPMHYPLAGDLDLLQWILVQQRQLVRDRQLDESLAGVSHHEAYGQMLEVAHLERTIRSRYTDVGLVNAIVAVASASLVLSEDQVVKYRKAISRCRRGRRNSIPWLRPKTR